MKPPEKIPQIDWQNGAYSTVPSIVYSRADLRASQIYISEVQ